MYIIIVIIRNIMNKIPKVMDVSINSRCFCKKVMTYDIQPLIILIPCLHIMHENCYFKSLKYAKNKCPSCGKKYKMKLTEKDLQEKRFINNTYNQIWIDVNSLKVPNTSYISNFMYLKRIPQLLMHFSKIKYSDFYTWMEELVSILNIKIEVENAHLINVRERKIYIANHINYLDAIPLYLLTKCGFITSSWIKESGLLNYIKLPLLMVSRGQQNNTVDQIKTFLHDFKNPNLCIFPEGLMKNETSLIEFRTGAFNCDVPIQPIVIEYRNAPYAENIKKYAMSIVGQNSKYPITIKLKVLKTYYPPFLPEVIKKIRKDMAKKGKLYLSRVSNRDVIDK